MKNTKNPVQFRVFHSSSFDPCLNLATEEYLFTHSESGEHIVFFYRNSPCVILGRFQNPWNECRPYFLKRKNIPLLRRISGGGAVYHDQGNINFCIITDQDCLSREEYLSRIQQGLTSLGVKTTCENKNSLTMNGYKISGSAYRFRKNRVLYHGTMLVNADLEMLHQCLIPAHPALKNGTCTGGTASKRYNVINLKKIIPGITLHKVMQALAVCFTRKNHVPVEHVQKKVDWKIIQTLVEKNRSFEWVYG